MLYWCYVSYNEDKNYYEVCYSDENGEVIEATYYTVWEAEQHADIENGLNFGSLT